MTHFEQQIRRAQHRLWMNRWLNRVSWSIAVAATALAAVVMVQRLYDYAIPLAGVSLGLLGAAILASIVWCIAGRESAELAAARLDEAAGLRERISSGRYCSDSDDPFARAVLADADRVSANLSVRQHIRLTVPQPLGFCAGALVLMGLMFLIPVGVLADDGQDLSQQQSLELQRTKIAVKKRLDDVIKLAQTNPALEDLKVELDKMREEPSAELQRPDVIRHEALKKIDKLADAVNKKRTDPKYESVNEFRKMMRGLQMPKQSDSPAQKVTKALAQGDFKTAREEIKALQEQLATLKSDQDKELVEKLSKQLSELSKQLQKVAMDKQLMQKLQQAGIKKEDLERMLENLSKKDLDQVKKALEQKGMSQQQIDKLVKQMQQKQMAGSTAKQLSKAMQQASQCNNPGQMGDAIAGLSQAADQMTELEMLEAEMSQLDATMASLDDAKDGLSPCSTCNGTGMCNGGSCPGCGGSGSGMGRNPGQGRGGLAPERKTGIGFKIVRGKVKTGKGAIIGQFLVDGEQQKGDVSSDFVEVVTAAERDATDAVSRDRVPRQYQKAVKEYFTTVRKAVKATKEGKDGGSKDGGEDGGDDDGGGGKQDKD